MTGPVTNSDPKVEVLLVEDNPGDVELTRIALREAKLSTPLRVVTDGEEAIAYLRSEPPFEHARRPVLILLDLNLPRMDGHEVLKTLKSDPDLKHIPVCILTTSGDEMDIATSYRLYANSYIQKPSIMDHMVTVVAQINEYWLNVVQLPQINLHTGTPASE